MNRFDVPLPTRGRFRLSATVAVLAASGMVGAVTLTGCSSGQISQSAAQASAVDGTATTINNVALRNVHILAEQTDDALRPGATVDLVLVASNQSPDAADKLVGITTDIGTVTLTGDPRLPAAGVLFVGTPNGQDTKAVDAMEAAETAKATVALTRPITNGLTYNFTFDFDKAGRVSVPVPISAPPAARQEQIPAPAKHP